MCTCRIRLNVIMRLNAISVLHFSPITFFVLAFFSLSFEHLFMGKVRGRGVEKDDGKKEEGKVSNSFNEFTLISAFMRR